MIVSLKYIQYTIFYIEKNTNNKKNSFRRNECYKKIHSLFSHELQLITVLILICDSYMSWSKILHISLCGIFHFWLRLVFEFIFLFYKKYGLFHFKEASTKNCETVTKYKSVMKIFFNVMLNKVLNRHFWKWIKW